MEYALFYIALILFLSVHSWYIHFSIIYIYISFNAVLSCGRCIKFYILSLNFFEVDYVIE